MTKQEQKTALNIYFILEEWREYKQNIIEDSKMWLRDKENSNKSETKKTITALQKEVLNAEKGIDLIKKLYNK